MSNMERQDLIEISKALYLLFVAFSLMCQYVDVEVRRHKAAQTS